jgi:hypothetical protein
MIEKCAWMLVAVLGTAAVLLICLFGLDPFCDWKNLSRWERRLLGAGLAALAALGWLPLLAGGQDAPLSSTARDPEATRALAAIAALEKLLTAWPEDPETVRAELEQAEEVLDVLPLAPPAGWLPADLLLFEERNRIKVTVPPSPDFTESLRLRSRLEQLAAEARARLRAETGELADTADWQAVERGWRRAAPWNALDGLALHGGTTPERHRTDYEMCLATAAVRRLERAGRLLPAEAGLLLVEADRLRENIYAGPPDDVDITCYRPMTVAPARLSTERLGERLHLLRRLAEGRRVAGPVVEKVLGVIREDLAVLSAEERLRDLSEEERDELPQLREEVAWVLEEIDALERSAGRTAGGAGHAGSR